MFIFRLDFSKWWVLSKCAEKSCSRNKFLVSEYVFKLVCLCESCTGLGICWALDKPTKNLWAYCYYAYLRVILFTKLGKDTATKAYLKPSQTYVMELFYKRVNYFGKSSIIDVWHGSKYAPDLKIYYLLLQYRWQ